MRPNTKVFKLSEQTLASHMKRFEAYISTKERDLIEAMIETGTLTRACEKLHISTQTGSMRMRAIKLRHERAVSFITEYEKLFRELAIAQSKFLR